MAQIPTVHKDIAKQILGTSMDPEGREVISEIIDLICEMTGSDSPFTLVRRGENRVFEY